MSNGPANIVLIGPRGAGKSTVGRLVATRLAWRLVDTDEQVERRLGLSIRAIFERRGERVFRDAEQAVIAELNRARQTVISVGGGAVLREYNRKTLAGLGLVIWLDAAPDELATRIQADGNSAERRPPLVGGSRLDEMRSILAEREPLYAATASLRLDTSAHEPAALAEQIVGLVLASAPAGEARHDG